MGFDFLRSLALNSVGSNHINKKNISRLNKSIDLDFLKKNKLKKITEKNIKGII